MRSLKSGNGAYTKSAQTFYPVEASAVKPLMRRIGQHDFGTLDDVCAQHEDSTVCRGGSEQRALQPESDKESIADLMNLDRMVKLGDPRGFVAHNALTKFINKQKSNAKIRKFTENPYRVLRFYKSIDGEWTAKSRKQDGISSYVVIGDQPASEQEVWLVEIVGTVTTTPQKVFQVSLVKKIFDESLDGIRIEMNFDQHHSKWSGKLSVGDTKVTCIADRVGEFYPTQQKRFWFASYTRAQHITADKKAILCFVKLIREDTIAKEAHIRHVAYVQKMSNHGNSNKQE